MNSYNILTAALCVMYTVHQTSDNTRRIALLKLDTRRSSRNLTANRPHPGSGSASSLITKLKLKLILLYMVHYIKNYNIIHLH